MIIGLVFANLLEDSPTDDRSNRLHCVIILCTIFLRVETLIFYRDKNMYEFSRRNAKEIEEANGCVIVSIRLDYKTGRMIRRMSLCDLILIAGNGVL